MYRKSTCDKSPYVLDADTADWNSALCPAGQVQRINDTYINLDKRTLEGTDIIIDYGIDTAYGEFSAKFVSTHYDNFYQEASGVTQKLIDAAAPGGPLDNPNVVPPNGFQNLLGKDASLKIQIHHESFLEKWPI